MSNNIILSKDEEEFLKDFDSWIEIKKDMELLEKMPTIKEGEVWWCGVGANVGVEISGKGCRFSRPVLILKKLSRLGFMGVPLTSKSKTGSWYVSFELLGIKETAAICQAKTISVFRLYDKIGQVPKTDLEKVKEGFRKLYF